MDLSPRTRKSGEFVTAGVTPDRNGVITLTVDIDPSQLEQRGMSARLVMEVAADKPGVPDDELDWRFHAACGWSGTKHFKGDGNPGISINGRNAEGKRARLRVIPDQPMDVGVRG